MSQGWSKIFNRINWLNRPNTNTPLNATNLNAGDSAIDKLDDRIITLDTVKADMQVVNGMVADVSLNSNTGVITVTYKNGSHVDYDTNLEKIAVNFSYDYINQRLVLTLPDGTTQYVDMSALITQYEFKDSTTIAFSVDSTGKVSASVKNGSITEAMLETGYLANIKVEVAKAEAAASQAQSSEASSDYNAKLSRSYAIGGSGIREGEDTDNAMYYYEQAKKTDIGQIRSEVAELNSNLDVLEYSDVAGGKNLFNKNYVYDGYPDNTTGLPNGSSIYGQVTSDEIKVKPNGKYIKNSFNNANYPNSFFDENHNFICREGTSSFITVPSNAHYIRVCLSKSEIDTFQFEEGTTPTDYEPYIPSVKMLAEEVSAQNESLSDYGLTNVFDGVWEQGGYNGSTGEKYSDTIAIRSVTPISVKSGSLCSMKANSTIKTARWVFFNGSTFVGTDVGFVVKAPSNSTTAYFHVIKVDGGAITPQTVGEVNVYINNSIEEIKNDLDTLEFGEVAGGKNICKASDNGVVNEITLIKKDVSTIIISGASDSRAISKNFNVKKGITYTATFFTSSTNVTGFLWNSIKQVTAYTFGSSKTITFTPTEDETLSFAVILTDTVSNVEISIQVEEGSKSTSFEPYIPSVKMLAEENAQQSTEAMDLKMLGWSVPKECPIQNEVSGNQFIQKVGRIDLGTLAWAQYATVSGVFMASYSDLKNNGYIYADGFVYYTPSWTESSPNKCIAIHPSLTSIYIKDTTYTDVENFKNSLVGKYAYYELATPITMTIDGNEAVTQIKNDLGGLSLSTSGTTLTITDGTNTWTLEAN